MKCKVGDLVYCKKTCVMDHSGEIATVTGKYYKIIKKYNKHKFTIIDENKEEHLFDNKNKWFISLKNARKQKIRKLQIKSLGDGT